MAVESLTELEIINGILTLAQVILYMIIGAKILSKYFTYKRSELLAIGTTWIFLSSGWWGSGFSFLTYILIGRKLDVFLYLFLSNAFIPIAIISWIHAFCKMAYPHLKKILLPIYLISGIIFEILLIMLLITDPLAIGTLSETFYYSPGVFSMFFQILAILTAFITGTIFSMKSMKSMEPQTNLKGKFLMIAFLSFTIGALLDASVPLNPFTIIIVRSILMSASIEYYLGFHLPDKIARFFLHTE